MFYFWGLFVMITLSDLRSEVSCEENELNPPYDPVLLPQEEIEKESDTMSGLSPEALKDIHVIAKNISHSKPAYQEINTKVNGEKEVRRSILRKSEITFGSNSMKDLLVVFDKLRDEIQLEVLELLENLVHQYDVAINFADMGGLKIIAPFLFSSNDTIVSSVALVLGAAMQSNPHVQKLAKDQNIGKNLLELLSHNSTIVLSRIIYALSTFLRNAVEAQEEFIAVNGIYKLSVILENPNIDIKTKLKVIILFTDLAVEQQDAIEHYQELRRAALQRSFAEEIIKCNICEHIASFLSDDDFNTLEKTVAAMISLDVVCHQDFTSVKDQVKKLLIIYDPLSVDKDSLHLQLDKDLRSTFHSQLNDLIKKMEENADKSNQHSSKDEL